MYFTIFSFFSFFPLICLLFVSSIPSNGSPTLPIYIFWQLYAQPGMRALVVRHLGVFDLTFAQITLCGGTDLRFQRVYGHHLFILSAWAILARHDADVGGINPKGILCERTRMTKVSWDGNVFYFPLLFPFFRVSRPFVKQALQCLPHSVPVSALRPSCGKCCGCLFF